MQFITYFNCRLKCNYTAYLGYPLYWVQQCIANGGKYLRYNICMLGSLILNGFHDYQLNVDGDCFVDI